jgi:hypothetical protein
MAVADAAAVDAVVRAVLSTDTALAALMGR